MAEHEYLMSIQRYFGGEKRFMVTAFSKEEAVEKAKSTLFYHDDNTISSSLKCVRKLKPSFGKEEQSND
jgi:hypothetical protein